MNSLKVLQSEKSWKFCERQTWFRFYVFCAHILNSLVNITFFPVRVHTERKDKSGITDKKKKKSDAKWKKNHQYPNRTELKVEQPRKQEILIKDKHMSNKAKLTAYNLSAMDEAQAFVCCFLFWKIN